MSLEDCERFFSLLGVIEKRSAKSVRGRFSHPDGFVCVAQMKRTPQGKLELARRHGDPLVFAVVQAQWQRYLSGQAPVWHVHQIVSPPLPSLDEFQVAHDEIIRDVRVGAVTSKRFREHLLRAPISLFDLLGKPPSSASCAEIDQKLAEAYAERANE